MIYAIGDVHGHYEALQRLLEQIAFGDDDVLWLTGDLVNRGPQSVETLRFVARTKNVRMVLGNHDVGLLVQAQHFPEWGSGAVAEALRREEDGAELLDFLRRQPFIIHEQGVVLSHAGLHPSWTLEEALCRAQEVEEKLQGDDYIEFLRQVYGDEPRHDGDDLPGSERRRFAVNALCRMRYLDADEGLNLREHRWPPAGALKPWFALDLRCPLPQYFGHWASLGHHREGTVHCLDGGYAWGGALVAWNVTQNCLAGRLAAS